MLPARPPLPPLVQSAQAPKDQSSAQYQPSWLTTFKKDLSAKAKPNCKSAEQYENQFNGDAQQLLRREHFRRESYWTRSMRTFMVTGVRGRSLASRATLEILSATSCPSTTSPKMLWRLSRWGGAATVMKNWLPFVPGPALAIESFPALLCFSEG